MYIHANDSIIIVLAVVFSSTCQYSVFVGVNVIACAGANAHHVRIFHTSVPLLPYADMRYGMKNSAALEWR